MIAANRIRRSSLKARSATTRAQAAITRRGEATLTTYAVAAGLPIKAARSVAGSLRKAAVKLGITGTRHRTHAARRCRHQRPHPRMGPARRHHRRPPLDLHRLRARRPALRRQRVRRRGQQPLQPGDLR